MVEEVQPVAERVVSAAVVTARYVRIGGPLKHIAEAITALTTKAMDQKIDSGKWEQGRVWVKGPDGHRYLDVIGYESWVERGWVAKPKDPA